MPRWLKDHSLSLALLALLICFHGAALIARGKPIDPDYISTFFLGCADGTITALILVLLEKWFYERGSNGADE